MVLRTQRCWKKKAVGDREKLHQEIATPSAPRTTTVLRDDDAMREKKLNGKLDWIRHFFRTATRANVVRLPARVGFTRKRFHYLAAS